MASAGLSRRVEKVPRFLAVSAGAVALLAPVAPAAGADPVIAAAGDIACSPSDSYGPSTCHQRETSDLLVGTALDAVLPLGDIQYDSASLANIMAVYDPSWGRVKSISHPILGNHEGSGRRLLRLLQRHRASRMGRPGRGQGLVQLRCRQLAPDRAQLELRRHPSWLRRGSEQERWLRADLAAHPASAHSPTGTTRATAPATTDQHLHAAVLGRARRRAGRNRPVGS